MTAEVVFALSVTSIALIGGAVFLAGVVNGVAGFGFALVGTMALASVFDPATAVVFMIVPILAVNLTLVRELDTGTLRSCGSRFGPLIAGALIGTVAGMAVLGSLPAQPLRVGLGALTLSFVVTSASPIALPGVARLSGTTAERPAIMASIGAISGLLFGGTNVGVQFIAYLRSRDLGHGLFVGVVAMVFLGLNGARVLTAALVGLYPGAEVFGASLGAAAIATVGVTTGSWVRGAVGESLRESLVLVLLAGIGMRLVLGGLGVV